MPEVRVMKIYLYVLDIKVYLNEVLYLEIPVVSQIEKKGFV